MKIAIISDTHCRHHELTLPPVDIIFHTGDFTAAERIDQNKMETDSFLAWLTRQKANHKIFIAGNHELYMSYLSKKGESFSYVKENYPELIYLENSSVSIDGKLIYGTPYCPIFGYWAFMKHEFELEKIFKGINKKTQILLTHTPAFGTLDVVEGWRSGSEALVDQIDKLDDLKYHFFGHIHESYGMKDGMKYTSVNSSICSPRGLNNPVILDI